MTTYPAPPIPPDKDLAGNYYYEAIRLAHTGVELENLGKWLDGQTLCLDDEGRTVVFARDYERWVDRRRVQGYGFEADRQRSFMTRVVGGNIGADI